MRGSGGKERRGGEEGTTGERERSRGEVREQGTGMLRGDAEMREGGPEEERRSQTRATGCRETSRGQCSGNQGKEERCFWRIVLPLLSCKMCKRRAWSRERFK